MGEAEESGGVWRGEHVEGEEEGEMGGGREEDEGRSAPDDRER